MDVVLKKTMMIEQNHFSALIKSFLEIHFSEFIPTLKFQSDGSFDCDLRNPTNLFSIWIATYNSEITLGIEDPNGKSDIHTHISCYEESEISETLSELSIMINNIKNDKTVLYYKDESGFQWTNNKTSILNNNVHSKNIRFYSWEKGIQNP